MYTNEKQHCNCQSQDNFSTLNITLCDEGICIQTKNRTPDYQLESRDENHTIMVLTEYCFKKAKHETMIKN